MKVSDYNCDEDSIIDYDFDEQAQIIANFCDCDTEEDKNRIAEALYDLEVRARNKYNYDERDQFRILQMICDRITMSED